MKHQMKTANACRISSIHKLVFIALLLLGLSIGSQAQDNIQEKSYEPLFYVELDPFAYINKGYSIHLGYENWGWRFDLTKVKVDFPVNFEDAFYGTKAFDLITKINGIKIDYIGNRTNWTKGAFVGLDVNHQTLNFTHRETLESKDLNAFNIGLRAGYKFNIYKGFYITPWAAVWKNVATDQSFNIANDNIAVNEWDWITTLHLGYAFKF